MAVVKPFRAWRYDPNKFARPGEVIVPPYDVITESEREAFQRSNPVNFANVILAQGDEKHKRAAEVLARWQKNGTLIQDESPGYYFYKQEFELTGYEKFCQSKELVGDTFTRYGFFARVQVEEYSNNVILPHEKTFAKYKQDRYDLMTECKGQMEPVFLGYDSSFMSGEEFSKAVAGKQPLYDYKDNYDVSHRLWLITNGKICAEVSRKLATEKLYILDGHHRYETSLKFYQDHPSEKARYVLADVCAFRQPGMVILPTHRLLSGLADGSEAFFKTRVFNDFDFVKVDGLGGLENKLRGSNRVAFGVTFSGEGHLYFAQLKTDLKVLDLDYLHNTVLKPDRTGAEPSIYYVRSIPEFFDELKSKRHQVGIIVRPNTYADVIAKASHGQVMPHKSTFFYPKVPSGLVINKFDH